MNTRERIVIYGTLTLLLGINISAITGVGGRHAVAADDSSADQLGPAEALTLVDKDHRLVLRNQAGRLSWGDGDHARAYSIGFVYVEKAIGPLLKAELYAEERDQLEEDIRATDKELDASIAAFMKEHRDLNRDGPLAESVTRAYQQLVQERERWRVVRVRRRDRLTADQMERAFRDVVAAVEVVADRRDIDIVWRFVPTADAFPGGTPAQASMAIGARLVLRYPEALDITDNVFQELALEVE